MERNRSDTDDESPQPMTLQRFQELLDAYGAEPTHWPEEERAVAEALLARSAEARTFQEHAAHLDHLLNLAPSVQPSPELRQKVLAQVPPLQATEIAPKQRPVFSLLRPGQRQRRLGAVRSAPSNFTHHRRVWSSLVAALLVIVGVWSTRALRAPQQMPTLDPATLGIYETPTDVLLESPGFDLFSAMPSIGCEDSDLACPQLDAPQDTQSQSYLQGRKLV
ncbi:MAG: hypothetical protein FJ147_17015 [Deltaproteobacteria bacterium]|nr:hypothetical protein [Deltaproteobacteria bacterium]